MTRRDVVRTVMDGGRPPWVPWSFSFTVEARAKLAAHFGREDLDTVTGDHLLELGHGIGMFEPAGPDRVRDVFGVVWDRSVDKDIGVVRGCLLPEPTLRGFEPPDPRDPRLFESIPARLAAHPDRFRVYSIGFSLYERAWTLRGMENLLLDFIERPAFVRDLLETLADYNIAQAREAMRHDVDAVYFGDDWGQQRGLQMGPAAWRAVLRPVLARMYGAVREAGRYVIIHSCGDVDELFDDLVEIGVNCFNPLQPEVMDVFDLLPRYRGRLAFYGGLSAQRTLPFGTPEEVRQATRRLLDAGAAGGYILAPAHAVESDVPLDNMLAFIAEAQAQLR